MTRNTGYIHTVNTREMHGGQSLAVNLRISNQHTFGDHRLLLLLLLQVDVNQWTDKCDDSLMVGFCTDNQHLVAHMEYRISVGDGNIPIVLDA